MKKQGRTVPELRGHRFMNIILQPLFYGSFSSEYICRSSDALGPATLSTAMRDAQSDGGIKGGSGCAGLAP